MKLTKYKAKRNLKSSKEPSAILHKRKKRELVFVIQEHQARQLHYDLRLEVDGILKSWAVPKQPTLDPNIKRLAIMVEDHPYAYKDFEGVISEGYGAGTVTIWDHGSYSVDKMDPKASEKAIKEGLKKGLLHFSLYGEKLKGTFLLVKLKNSKNNQWLLMKKKDKAPLDSQEKNVGVSNLNKIFWPKDKITKGDLLNYYARVSKWILPYLKDRPESLRRFPNGIEGEAFFQKNLKQHPQWIETTTIQHQNKKVDYLLIQNQESLIYAANLGCIELHPFFSRTHTLDYPDFLVFDLDPKMASFAIVIKVAKELHALLEEIGAASYCKTSGATGLHIAVPLGAKYTYDQAKQFAELVALVVHQRIPNISTLERSISKRKGKVYIDCYQNNLGQTLASVYSVRAKPGAPVSTPLKWSEVKTGLDPRKYTIHSVLPRIKKLGDLFAPVLGKGIDMMKAVKNLTLIA